MTNNFCLIFDEKARLTDSVNKPVKVQKYLIEEMQKKFFLSLLPGDKERFIEFCATPPDFQSVSRCAALFKLFDFYSFTWAFAEKNILEGETKILVYVFKRRGAFQEFLSPLYLRFLPTVTRLDSEKRSVFSPAGTLVFDKAPYLMNGELENTDILELTERILEIISSDPVFYGNEISLEHENPDNGMNDALASSFIVEFSTSAYIHIFYSLLAVFSSVSHSHKISLKISKAGFGAILELKTDTTADCAVVNGATDLLAAASFAKQYENLLAFAEYVAVANEYEPSVHFNPDASELSVSLGISVDFWSEGEFRYREPYDELREIVLEASGMYRLLA